MAPSPSSNPWNAPAWVAALQQLLPEGWGWRRDPDAVITKLLTGLADEPARLVVRALELLEELDPRKAEELLAEWGAVVGLPSPCFPDEQAGGALANAVARELTVEGGQTPARFVARAEDLGYAITVTELDAARAGVLTAGQPVRGEEWVHVWQVTTEGTPTEYLRAGAGRAGQRLVTRYQFDLECVLEAERPAHTEILFEYQEA